MDEIVIDTLNTSNIANLVEKYETCFNCSWSKQQFIEAISCKNHLVYVARKDNEILGFLVISCSIDTVDILNIAIHVNYMRKKIATKLLNKLINDYIDYNILLEVNITNIPAINLYNLFGFQIISTRKGYYLNKETNTKEDAYIMKL